MVRFFASGGKGPGRRSFRVGVILGFALVTTASPGPALAQPNQPSVGSVIAGCEACHGTSGNSSDPSIPRLNGQRTDYMMGRFAVFGDPSQRFYADVRMRHSMFGMAEDTRKFLAGYFSAQAPTAPRPGPLAAQGRKIYQRGVPGENVLACQLCHGNAGEGRDLAPRIAGQHGVYLKTQILEFNSTVRPHGTMNSDAHKLTDNQVAALIAYLGTD